MIYFLALTRVGLGGPQVRDLIDPLFESKVPNAAGVEDQTGDALPRITREAHCANVPGKNVAHSWPKNLCLLLEPRQTQIPVLQHNAVNRVDFFADRKAPTYSRSSVPLGVNAVADSNTICPAFRPRSSAPIGADFPRWRAGIVSPPDRPRERRQRGSWFLRRASAYETRRRQR